jgi:hypothetical protein
MRSMGITSGCHALIYKTTTSTFRYMNPRSNSVLCCFFFAFPSCLLFGVWRGRFVLDTIKKGLRRDARFCVLISSNVKNSFRFADYREQIRFYNQFIINNIQINNKINAIRSNVTLLLKIKGKVRVSEAEPRTPNLYLTITKRIGCAPFITRL